MSLYAETCTDATDVEVERYPETTAITLRTPQRGTTQLLLDDGICGPTVALHMAQDLNRVLVAAGHADDLLPRILDQLLADHGRSQVETLVAQAIDRTYRKAAAG